MKYLKEKTFSAQNRFWSSDLAAAFKKLLAVCWKQSRCADEVLPLRFMSSPSCPAPPSPGRCASCGENVVGEGTGCTAMDQVFHVDCFVCMTCSTKLRGKPFFAVEKKAYCEPCYIVSRSSSPALAFFSLFASTALFSYGFLTRTFLTLEVLKVSGSLK